jgi:hypothetical protein
MTRYFYAEVKTENMQHSDLHADHLAQQYGDKVVKAGGVMNVGKKGGYDYAWLVLELPDGVNPDEVFPPGLSFHVARVAHMPTVEDHGIGQDE